MDGIEVFITFVGFYTSRKADPSGENFPTLVDGDAALIASGKNLASFELNKPFIEQVVPVKEFKLVAGLPLEIGFPLKAYAPITYFNPLEKIEVLDRIHDNFFYLCGMKNAQSPLARNLVRLLSVALRSIHSSNCNDISDMDFHALKERLLEIETKGPTAFTRRIHDFPFVVDCINGLQFLRRAKESTGQIQRIIGQKAGAQEKKEQA